MVAYRKRRVYKRARKMTGKRIYRSKTRRQPRMNRPDSGYSEKLTSTYDLRTNGGAGLATLNVNWHCVNGFASNSQNAFFFDSCGNQWKQCKEMWRDYKITGLSIKYRPFNISLYNNNFIKQQFAVSTSMNKLITGGQNPNQMTGPLDFKTYDPERPFKRFYRVGKWWNQQMQRNYRLCDDAPLQFNEDFNCTTQINMQTAGTLADDFQVGTVEITWYVKFKTRTSAF